ncbi:MFS transporter [Streptosporangium sp. NPDC000396]|uniref:MFS transporter n=1 Tax=Streptosporangium sp. NPDC000396 TaxID=3366185 RepID=UPI00367ED8BB
MTSIDGSPQTRSAEPPASSRTPWRAVSVVMAGTFMATLDSFIVVVAGPAIQTDLGASGGELQWILAGYQLTYAVFLITGGRLGDLHGRKRVFILGMALFTASSIACALSGTAISLIAARLVQGLGAALMVPQVFAVITLLVPDKGRHRAFGVLGVAMGLASIGGQLIGGLLVGADLFGSGWRPVFWINVPIGLATILLTTRFIPESRAASAREIDVAGVVALTVALFLLVFPLIQGHEAGWPWWTWAGLAASRLVPKYGRRVLEAGAIVLAVGYASTAVILMSGLRFTPGLIIPTLMLQSVGGGLLITPSLNAVLARINPDDVGVASGALSTAQQVGGALGVAIIGSVFFNAFPASTGGGAEAAAHALAMSSIFTLVTAIVATLLVYLLPTGRRA